MKKRAQQQQQQQQQSFFKNTSRINKIYEAIVTGDRKVINEVVEDRKENSTVYKKIKGKNVVWEDLKDEVVFRLAVPGQAEQCVIKLFPEDLPFHEVCGNVIATKLSETAGPFFVKCLDVGQFPVCGNENDNCFFIMMEYFEDDTDSIDIDEPINMYNLFYQVNYAIHQLSQKSCGQLQHFDLRYDNIRIKMLNKKKDFFNNNIKTNFLIKIGDWGQCEFDFGFGLRKDVDHQDADAVVVDRIVNEDVPREEQYVAKWGEYPLHYSNYDFQYFLSTLTPVLDNLQGLSFYYIYNMLMDFMQPVSFTEAQDRPIVITMKTPQDTLIFMKSKVLPGVELLPDDDNE